MSLLALALVSALMAPGGIGEASLEIPSEPGAVGAPFPVVLAVRAPLPEAGGDALSSERAARQRLRARFGESLFEEGVLDDSWVLFDVEPLVIRRAAGVESGAELVAELRFRLVSLEAGNRRLPLPDFEGELEPAEREFASALAEGEDAPRPLRGFRPLPPEVEDTTRSTWPFAVLGGALALALLGFVLVRRRRGVAAPGGHPEEALGRLVESLQPGDPESIKAAHYYATALLRSSLDRRRGWRTPAGATDEEWLGRRAEAFGEASRQRLEDFFAACAEVKYGGTPATEWGLSERVGVALELLAEEGDD
jgi:hypothetical protein